MGEQFQTRLDACRDVVRKSRMFSDVCWELEPYRAEILRIRCLAIGSFYTDLPARYQLALLLELIGFLSQGDRIPVSIYDPVFCQDDLEYIRSVLKWTIDEEIPSCRSQADESTLFFLPHAPLDLTENVIKNECPKFWLANNLITHTDRYSKSKLYETYPVISKLVSLIADDSTTPNDDGFIKFTSKKGKKRRNNKSCLKYEQPKIDYALIESYFESCKLIKTFDTASKDTKPWHNSFTDLALHLIQ